MKKSKPKKLQQKKSIAGRTEESTSTKVPIDNLPEKFLWMHVSALNLSKLWNVIRFYSRNIFTLKGEERYKDQKCSWLRAEGIS